MEVEVEVVGQEVGGGSVTDWAAGAGGVITGGEAGVTVAAAADLVAAAQRIPSHIGSA